MPKLRKLEVFGVTKVTLKRELEGITGEPDDGDLVVWESDTCFTFYIKTSDLESGDVPYSALANRLSEVLGIDDENKQLVMDILVTQSQRRLEAILEQYGFHSELYEDHGSNYGSEASNDYSSTDASDTVQTTNYVSYERTERSSEALDYASREEDSRIGQSRMSVTKAACSFGREQIKIEHSNMVNYPVSGERLADHEHGQSLPALEHQHEPSQRVWDTEGMRLALPESSSEDKIKRYSSKPPPHFRSDLVPRVRSSPRSEASWEEDQETGYLGELFVSLSAVD